MRNFFGGGEGTGSSRGPANKIPRHSSGWKDLQKYLKEQESLRVLDIGPTSSTNINYLTSLGHSIYMANLVEEAARPEWVIAGEGGEGNSYDVDRFIESNLNFSGRNFDVVMLWDTADFLPEAFVGPMFERLRDVIVPGGRMLAFFHSTNDPNAAFCRYHLTDTEMVEMQKAGSYPLLNSYNNRKIENLLSEFASYRFFLAKDSLREVIVTR
ncbi:class I SAM-dependent methyltransferase [Edaphobacter albus]|uniref:class I SAM-dependent methyltransferase n=1 Tax=Edaphobacter sp. 4G125 TaxID=2763071 RepID=UPI0021070DC2|nr:class I SAM-dependent methyltransferase [Edaphobacter sp. 4G125]